MTDFATLLEGVYSITNHRELIAQTTSAVKSATLQMHRKDFFAKDLLEVALQFTTSDYLQSIEYRTLFPRYRALKVVRKFDPTEAAYPEYGMGPFFTIITPEQVLDSYQQTRNDVAYIAGSSINLRSSTAIQYCNIGIYQNPEVGTPETYSSWIADEFPDAIIYAAAAIVQGGVLRDNAGAQFNNSLAMNELQAILTSNITGVGE
jgi:hypothetical protein